MAIWQYCFYFAPEKALAGKYEVIPSSVSADDGNAAIEGVEARILDAAAQEFDKHLKRAKSWHRDISAWGTPEGNHVEISRFSTGLGAIRVRIDVRDLDDALLARVVEIAKRLDCLFITTDNQVVPAKAGKLLAQLRSSPAQRFVEDPEAYFREIAEADAEEQAD